MQSSAEENSSTLKAVSQRVPLWRDVVVIKWVTQLGLLAVVVASLWFLAGQAGDNLQARNINTGFDFLERPPDIQLSEGIDTSPATGGRALWVGMVNTLRMAVVGIIFATFLGVVVGLARLSNNWLIKRLAGLWIETLRNVPLLVQMIFYFAVLTALPRVTLDSGPIHGWFHVSNKGISMPRVFISDGFYQWITVVAVGCIAAYFIRNQRGKKHDLTGEDTHAASWAFLTICTFAIIGIFVHPIFSFVGEIFAGLATLFENIPTTLVKILIASVLIFFVCRFVTMVVIALYLLDLTLSTG